MLKPIGDLIVVEPAEPEEKVGSIILAPSAKEEAKHGRAIAVGPGKVHDGWTEPMTVRKGDTVLYSKYAKEHFKFQGKQYLVLHEADVIGILD